MPLLLKRDYIMNAPLIPPLSQGWEGWEITLTGALWVNVSLAIFFSTLFCQFTIILIIFAIHVYMVQ